jgi:hypothetical protein
MAEAFAVGTFWFWALVAAEIVLLLVATEYETGIGATLSLVAFLTILQLWSGADIVGFTTVNWPLLLVAVVAYLFIGVACMICKWRGFVSHRIQKWRDTWTQYLVDHGRPAETTYEQLSAGEQRDWDYQSRRYDEHNHPLSKPPKVKDHKARVIRWMSLWPCVVVLFVTRDMVVNVYNKIYTSLAVFLQRIADNMYADQNLPPRSGGQ